MASNRERKLKLREERILRSAVRLIEQAGFAKLTMDQLAAEAGLAKATLYQHFRSKDELFVAMTLNALRELAAQFDAATGTAVQQLQSSMRFLMRAAASVDNHPPMTLHEDILQLFRQHAEVHALFGQISAQMFHLIEQAKKEGDIASIYDAAFVVSLIMTNINVIRGRTVYDTLGLSTDKLIEDTIRVLFSGLRPNH